MAQISASELKTNAEKRVAMAVDKKEVFTHFLSLFPKEGLTIDTEKVREERLDEKCF